MELAVAATERAVTPGSGGRRQHTEDACRGGQVTVDVAGEASEPDVYPVEAWA